MRYLLTHDLKRTIDIKRTLAFGTAALLSLFFFVQFFSEDMAEKRLLETLHIGIVDNEQSELSRMLIDSFKTNDQFTSLVTITVGSSERVNAEYDKGQLTAIITIPPHFTDSLLHYRNDALDVILNPNHPIQSMVLEEMLRSYSDYIKSVDAATYGLYSTLEAHNYLKEDQLQINELYSVEMISMALGRNRLFSYTLIDTFPSTTSVVYFGAAIIVIVAAYASTAILPLYFGDLKTHCVQRHLTIHTTLLRWVLSKLTATSLHTSLLCCMLALPLAVYFKLKPLSLGLLLFQIFMISLFFSALTLLIGILLKRESSATIASSLIVFVLGLVGGNFIPLPLMPKALQDTSAFTPNYWAIRSLLQTLSESQAVNIPVFIWTGALVTAAILFAAAYLKHTLKTGGIRYD
jgi:ABC-type multidrug transport system permease subunit